MLQALIHLIQLQKDFVAPKDEVVKLDVNKLVNVPTSLNNLKIKVDDSHVGKLKTVCVDLKKISDAVDKQVTKNTKFNTLKRKVNKLDKEIPDPTILYHINQYNTDKQSMEKKIVDVDKKIPAVSGLVTKTVFNRNISEVQNKILNVSGSVEKANYDAKTSGIEVKYITTSDYNEFMSDILDAKIKQK